MTASPVRRLFNQSASHCIRFISRFKLALMVQRGGKWGGWMQIEGDKLVVGFSVLGITLLSCLVGF